jgi:hypothetical protein
LITVVCHFIYWIGDSSYIPLMAMMMIAEMQAAMRKGFLLLIMFGHNSTYGVLNDTSHRSRSRGKKAREESSGGDVHV